MAQPAALMFKSLNVFQIFGANTNVGKTIVSTLLAKHLGANAEHVLYIKPLSTGGWKDADVHHMERYAPGVATKGIFSWPYPVSPHLAAKHDGNAVDDALLNSNLRQALVQAEGDGKRFALVETAGGVLSPGPSGNLQADIYRPLRLPALLVADHKLGGIASTISAFESLLTRGYDVKGLFMFKDKIYENHDFLKGYFEQSSRFLRRPHIAMVDPPPPRSEDDALDQFNTSRYYSDPGHAESLRIPLADMLSSCDKDKRLLADLTTRAHAHVWHPFMQHTERTPKSMTAIDSASGDLFQVYKPDLVDDEPGSLLTPAFDGSASWWTQGLGHGNVDLALTAAHAAGRYGHVMFANAAHEPAVSLAETLLKAAASQTSPARWRRPSKLTKVFYSDDGSTGMEVAVKMALKAASKRYGWGPEDSVEVLGLRGSYHGDTIGAMDCSEGNIYNQKVQWYKGRGVWLDFPQVSMKDGRWQVTPPQGAEEDYGGVRVFDDLEAVFSSPAQTSQVEKYRGILLRLLKELVAQGHKLGALIMEPVVLGAGGMLFVDPAFQRGLYLAASDLQQGSLSTRKDDGTIGNDHEAAKAGTSDAGDWTGMPTVLDEVFSGTYRFGQFAAGKLIGVHPDISVHAKLLTGGIVPMAVTLASESVYQAFLSSDKADALLHGHSYTAHPIGCMVANHSLDLYESMDREADGHPFGRSWQSGRKDWDAKRADSQSAVGVWSMWRRSFVKELSFHGDVEGVWALGTVLAIRFHDTSGGGYASTASIGVRDRLMAPGSDSLLTVHCRVLGNVLYLMASTVTTEETISRVQETLLAALRYG